MTKNIKNIVMQLLVILVASSFLFTSPVYAAPEKKLKQIQQKIKEQVTMLRKEKREQAYEKGELIVKYIKEVDSAKKSKLHKKFKSRKLKEFRRNRIDLIEIDPGTTIEEAIERYNSDPSVEYAEPNYIVHVDQSIPNDPFFDELFGLDNSGQTGGTPDADIDAPEAWDITRGDSSNVVVVTDTGIDYNHEDLIDNLWTNYAELNGAQGVDDDGNGYIDDIYGIDTLNNDSDPMDDHGHGTHCAGTIGAAGNNGIGVAGVNWDVKIAACKFLSSAGVGVTAGAIECLEYIRSLKDSGVNIVVTNNSWGCGGGCYSQALSDAIGNQDDILFIAAAGNAHNNNDNLNFYPAAFYLPNLIAVAATDHHDDRAGFSNYGRRTVHVSAPGVDIVSLRAEGTDMYGHGDHLIPRRDPDARYYRASGTSMASPHVAGMAALIQSQDMNRDWRAIKNLILAGGDDLAWMEAKSITGKRVNAFGSLTCTDTSVVSILQFPYAFSVGTPSTLSALSINCELPEGPVTATTSGGDVIHLIDDGNTPDLVAGDGIFTGTWIPESDEETFIVTSPSGSEEIYVSSTLIITNESLPLATTGEFYSEDLLAEGGNGAYSWSVIEGSLPPGLNLNKTMGQIHGTPSEGGIYPFTFLVEDGLGNTGLKAFELAVSEGELQITTSSIPPGPINIFYSTALTVTGGVPTYTWSIVSGDLPDGLSLNAVTGVISGTPTTKQLSVFTVQVTDILSGMDTTPLYISIGLNIITDSLPSGVSGRTYGSQGLAVEGGVAPYTWNVVSGSLPPGLALYQDGSVFGIPGATGTYNSTIQVTDADLSTDTQDFSITITADPIDITTETLPDAEASVFYSQYVYITGGVTPYACSISAGSLPPGMSMHVQSTRCRIYGMPTATGVYNFTLQITDAESNTGTQAMTLTVVAPPINITTETLPDAEASVFYSQYVYITGGVTPYACSIAAGSLPPGMSMYTQSNRCRIYGMPTATGVYNFTLQITDAESNTGTQAMTLTVVAPPINITTETLPDAEASVFYSQYVYITGGVTPYACSIAAGSLPPGISMYTQSNRCRIYGISTVSGAYNFTLQITDAESNVGTRQFTITVN